MLDCKALAITVESGNEFDMRVAIPAAFFYVPTRMVKYLNAHRVLEELRKPSPVICFFLKLRQPEWRVGGARLRNLPWNFSVQKFPPPPSKV